MTAQIMSMPAVAGRASRSRQVGILAAVALVLTALILSTGCASMTTKRPGPVTVPEIVNMSRDGTPAPDIIERMKQSGTVYRLKPSQLDALHEQGVADSVIDYMQQTYVSSVQRNQEWQDWSYWNEQDGWWYGGVPWGWPDDDDTDVN